jgi:signal transduction histidine kinase
VNDALGLLEAGRPYQLIPPSKEVSPLSWVRLAIPLEVNANTIGVWLLGKRDPDDLYPQADLPIIQALANQTAIVLDNLLQAERLQSMHQANVDRYETERHNLGRELHDVVLNDLAALLMTLDDNAKTPAVLKQYERLAQHLREIVSELRPPLLSYGLKLGLEELADNLMERNQGVSIHVRIEGKDTRYSGNMESHIYRMAQEACENAIRHGHASRIEILGNLQPNDLELIVVDNGSGFDAHSMFHVDYLLEHKHFGLAGMVERALLIGARLKINSARGTGTQVTIRWEPQN